MHTHRPQAQEAFFRTYPEYGYSPLITEVEGKLKKEFTKRDKSEQTILELLWKWGKVVVKTIPQEQVDYHFREAFGESAEPSKFVFSLEALKNNNEWAVKYENVERKVLEWITKYKDKDSNSKEYGYMSTCFGGKNYWGKLAKESGEEGFKLGNRFNKYDDSFKAFYTNVLNGNEEYRNYKEFIDKWGIITTKSENK